MNNKEYVAGLLVVVLAIIGVITLIVVNITPNYVGTWIASNGHEMKISKNKISSDGQSIDYKYDSQQKTISITKDGQSGKVIINKTNTDKDKLEMQYIGNDGTASSPSYSYRKGSKLANSAQASSKKLVAAEKASSQKITQSKKNAAKKQAAQELALTKLFSTDKRHVVKLSNDKYYFTTWTKEQITTESAKLRRESLDVSKQADDKFGQFTMGDDKVAFIRDAQRQFSSTLGTSMTFTSTAYQDNKENNFLGNVIPDPIVNIDDNKSFAPKEWYTNALAAQKVNAITTEDQYQQIIK